LVELAEAKLAGEEISLEAVKAATQPMFHGPDGEKIDTVVLACTHFPLLGDELRQAFPHVTYVDGGAGIARRIAYLTREQPWPTAPSEGVAVFTSAGTHWPLEASLARFGLGQILVL